MSEKCKPHCGHFTGRSVTDGLAIRGEAEVQCCHCGAEKNIGWENRSHTPKGHGPHLHWARTRYAWPRGWKNGNPEESDWS